MSRMSNATQPRTESAGGGISVPQSKLFWTCIVLGIVLILLGLFLFTGPVAGMAGVWGATLFVGAFVGYLCHLVWYRFGA